MLVSVSFLDLSAALVRARFIDFNIRFGGCRSDDQLRERKGGSVAPRNSGEKERTAADDSHQLGECSSWAGKGRNDCSQATRLLASLFLSSGSP